MACSSAAPFSGGRLVFNMCRPGFGDLCGQLIIIRQQNKVIRVVAVLGKDRHAACCQRRRDFTQLAGALLPEFPDHRLTQRLHRKPGFEQHASRFFPVFHQKMGIGTKYAAALQPHAVAPQQLSKARQLAGPVAKNHMNVIHPRALRFRNCTPAPAAPPECGSTRKSTPALRPARPDGRRSASSGGRPLHPATRKATGFCRRSSGSGTVRYQ
ncbi:hypothetical protein L1887_42791 [Cichorium endivia]|nr:hypothetical protein L1887_42791 [Cichorium endivia]